MNRGLLGRGRWIVLLGITLIGWGCNSGAISPPASSYRISGEIAADWTSPEVGVHQGYATDGQTHFLIDSSAIYCRSDDTAWTMISSSQQVLAGTPFNHFGDGDFWNGELWIAVEHTAPGPVFTNPAVMLVDPNSLRSLQTYDLTGIMPEISGLAISPSENLLYAVSWVDGRRIWKFNLPDMSPAGEIMLSKAIPKVQGISIAGGFFYISMESGLIFQIQPDGQVAGYLQETTVGSHEGLKVINDDLWWLVDPGGGHAKIFKFTNMVKRFS